MATTIKPAGLAIARKGRQFTCSWKIGDKNYGGGQWYKWIESPQGQPDPATSFTRIDTGATSKTSTLTTGAYYPYATTKLSSVGFAVCGRRATEQTPSGDVVYSDSLSVTYNMNIIEPNKPTVSQSLPESNRTVFSWVTSVSDTDARYFIDVEYQCMRVKNCMTTDGSTLTWNANSNDWRSGTGAATGSYVATEESGILPGESWTRWFRIRSRGPAGASAWVYAYHVYAKPLKPGAPTGKATTVGQGTDVTMSWRANKDAAHPIDRAEAQYLFGQPEPGLIPPSGGQWAVGQSSIDTIAADGASFGIDRVVGTDECLWARVVVYHDGESNATYSDAVLLQIGKMALPTGLTVDLNTSTRRAVVTAVNNSEISDSKLAVIYKNESGKESSIGVIPHGDTTVTVQCPAISDADAIAFGVAAFTGATYAKATMTSDTQWQGGDVPATPTNVTAEQTDTAGEVLVSWTWAWQTANRAEVSWSTNPNAWISTDQPATYTLNNSFAPSWRIAKLQTGVTWYFRVRLGKYANESEVWGPYSDIVQLNLTSEPAKPFLTLNKSVVAKNPSYQAPEAFTASWTYTSPDGTPQRRAEVWLVDTSGETAAYQTRIAFTESANKTLTVTVSSTARWATYGTIYLAVKTTSESGRTSEWSDPVPIVIATPLTLTAVISISEITVPTDEGTRTVNAITAMPITATITGAGEGGTTSITIERAADYIMDRPDEDVFNGYEGELICYYKQSGEAPITLTRENLLGPLDDTAQYRFIMTVRDTYGQTAERVIDFEPHWTHQAIVPEGTVVISDGIAVITPTAPAGTLTGDVCDIYRLSADKPVLVYEGAAFGESYVDPYPTIGESAGYRLVFRTADGDYITANNTKAWTDIPAGLTERVTIIDFDGRRVTLEHNMDISHTWEKAFTETRYLGGAIQGDWNPGISKHASVNAEMVATDDPALIEAMHRLASYAGICHVRTVDGLSFAADVQVSEARSYESTGKISVFNLAVSEVAAQGVDGVSLDEWEAETEGEE